MAFSHLVSCNENTEKLIKEKNLSPSECFQVGVMKMAFDYEGPNKLKGETIITETEKSKIAQMEKAIYTLQQYILKQDDELNKLRERNEQRI